MTAKYLYFIHDSVDFKTEQFTQFKKKNKLFIGDLVSILYAAAMVLVKSLVHSFYKKSINCSCSDAIRFGITVSHAPNYGRSTCEIELYTLYKLYNRLVVIVTLCCCLRNFTIHNCTYFNSRISKRVLFDRISFRRMCGFSSALMGQLIDLFHLLCLVWYFSH